MDEYLRIAYYAAAEQWRAAGDDHPSPEDLEAAYQRAYGAAYGALTMVGMDAGQAKTYAERAAHMSDDEDVVPPGLVALGLPLDRARTQLAAAVSLARGDLGRYRVEAARASAAARAGLDAYDARLGAGRYRHLHAPAAFRDLDVAAARLAAAARHLQDLEDLAAGLLPAVPEAGRPGTAAGTAAVPGTGHGSGPATARADLESALAKARMWGRRHGRAAVYQQIGDSGDAGTLKFYRDLLRGIAEGDPEVTSLYKTPDLTAMWNYDRSSLAADVGLTAGSPALEPAAQAYLDAAREEFWAEAARLAQRRLTAAGGTAGTSAGKDPAPGAGPDPF